MRILKSTTNLVANANYIFKRFLSASYSSSIVGDVPAPGGTELAQSWLHPPDLKPNISSNSLMLAVEHVSRNGTRDFSVISTEGGSFEVIHENLPNFSYLLRAENYCRQTSLCQYDILASCNKWILLKCERLTNSPYELLWNPTTNEMRPLPFFGWWPSLTTLYGWQCQSVGFDPATEDYKVVRFGFLDDCLDKARAALFSLKTASWKEIPYPYDSYMNSLACTCVHINGISYWKAFQAPNPTGNTIVSFDFTNDNFPALIPFPKWCGWFDTCYCFHIVEFRGSLAAIVHDTELVERRMDGGSVVNKPFDFEIWVWNDGWSFDSTCNFPPLDDDDVCVQRVLGLYKNDKALFQDSKGSLLLYDCHAKVLKDLGIRSCLHYDARVYPYVQST